MKRHLILVRHAKSRQAEGGQKDFDRELTDTGIQQASRLGRYLYMKEVIPDKILTSNAVRVKKTAMFVAEQVQVENTKIEEDEDLYEASVRTLMNRINAIDDSLESVMVIGHNPAMLHLCEHLLNDPVDSFPSCSMVYLSFSNLSWNEIDKGTGSLIEIKEPDDIQV